jgi:hypothetical protein
LIKVEPECLALSLAPLLAAQDGQDIKRSERIVALQVITQLEQQLRQELRDEGVDPDDAAAAEDDSMLDENGEVAETGYVDEAGEMRRPWCPATRILEHREMVRGRPAQLPCMAVLRDAAAPSIHLLIVIPSQHGLLPAVCGALRQGAAAVLT